jgi:hypothetical protein
MGIGHPTILCKTTILKEELFDLQYKISADYNFIVRCYLRHKTFFNTGIPVTIYKGNGASSKNHKRRIAEVFKIQRQFGIQYSLFNLFITLVLLFYGTIRGLFRNKTGGHEGSN